MKVDNINKLAVLNKARTAVREDANKIIGEENNVEMVQVRRLSKPSGRLYGSAVVYMAKRSDAETLLACGVVGIGGAASGARATITSSSGAQERRPASDAPAAGTGQTSAAKKCAAYGGPHRADDRGCREHKRLLDDMSVDGMNREFKVMQANSG